MLLDVIQPCSVFTTKLAAKPSSGYSRANTIRHRTSEIPGDNRASPIPERESPRRRLWTCDRPGDQFPSWAINRVLGSQEVPPTCSRPRTPRSRLGVFRNPCPGPFPKSFDLRALHVAFLVFRKELFMERTLRRAEFAETTTVITSAPSRFGSTGAPEDRPLEYASRDKARLSTRDRRRFPRSSPASATRLVHTLQRFDRIRQRRRARPEVWRATRNPASGFRGRPLCFQRA